MMLYEAEYVKDSEGVIIGAVMQVTCVGGAWQAKSALVDDFPMWRNIPEAFEHKEQAIAAAKADYVRRLLS